MLQKNQKINYYLVSEEKLKEIDKLGYKPRLLLHACCGPCSTFPLTYLCPHFDVTIFFNNSNIYPSEEYYRRLNELKYFLEKFKNDYGFDVKVIETPYDNESYNKDLEPFKDQPEGLDRCFLCYEKRMSEAFDFAEENQYEYFTTVMTISRQKNSMKLNEIANNLAKDHLKTQYFYSDFKKNNGLEFARQIRLKYNLYNQLYCGCKYTYEKGLKKAQEKAEKEHQN